jgi:DNA polymerase-3 subunit alpha
MVAINALARPLALKKKYEVEYANRKRGRYSGFNLYKIKDILSSRTNELLEKSYYLPIYQEQVQYVVADLCNISFAETNKLRKLINKVENKRTDEDRRIIESYRQKILSNKNIDNPEQVWNEIVGGLEYGFNIAHATAYTDLSMKQLHIKIKYPTEFYISVLNNEDNNLYANKLNHFIEIIREAESLGIEFKYPDINLSDFKSKKIGDKKILLGLGIIKGFGMSAFKKLEKNRPYVSITDFISRTKFNKNMVLSLVYAGCFDSMHSREECYKLLGEKYSKERELEDEFNSLCFILKKRHYQNIIFLRSKNKLSSGKYRYIYNDTNKEVFVYSKKDLPEGFTKDNLELWEDTQKKI